MYVHINQSHLFNGIAQIMAFLLGVALFAGLFFLLNLTPIGPDRVPYMPPWQAGCTIVLFVLLCLVSVWLAWKLFYKPLMVPASNWLFLRVLRKTSIPWADVVRLSPLFVPDDKTLWWFEARHIEKMPAEDRLDYLYTVAAAMGKLKLASNSRDMARDARTMSHPVRMALSPQDMIQKKSFWRRNITDRGVGVFAIVGSLVLGFIGIALPLIDAANHSKDVENRVEAVVLAPMLFLIGLAQLILGERSSRILGLPFGLRVRLLGWVLIFASLAAGIAVYCWLYLTLRSKGYWGRWVPTL